MVLHFQTLRRSISEEQGHIAQGAAESVSDYITDKIALLDVVARLGDIEGVDAAFRRRMLALLLGFDPAFRSVILYDRNLEEAEHATRQSEQDYRLFLDRLDRNWPSVADVGDQYISPAYFDGISNEPLVVVIVPVTDVFGDSVGRL